MKAVSAATMRSRVQSLSDPVIAHGSARYFKTGVGEYGAGDIFVGLRAPTLHALAKEFQATSLANLKQLLKSRIHEERLLALLILTKQFARADAETETAIYQLYLDHTAYINNWDLVDCSAPHIVGEYLRNRSKKILTTLAKSASLWERRIAILATFTYIRAGEFADTLKIAKILLPDKEDLIHKAVGWMLREIGKRDLACEQAFLDQYHQQMPRTMLRYAIEKFSPAQRERYLARK